MEKGKRPRKQGETCLRRKGGKEEITAGPAPSRSCARTFSYHVFISQKIFEQAPKTNVGLERDHVRARRTSLNFLQQRMHDSTAENHVGSEADRLHDNACRSRESGQMLIDILLFS
eukprot:3303071-Amphidinium_carterae.1